MSYQPNCFTFLAETSFVLQDFKFTCIINDFYKTASFTNTAMFSIAFVSLNPQGKIIRWRRWSNFQYIAIPPKALNDNHMSAPFQIKWRHQKLLTSTGSGTELHFSRVSWGNGETYVSNILSSLIKQKSLKCSKAGAIRTLTFLLPV